MDRGKSRVKSYEKWWPLIDVRGFPFIARFRFHQRCSNARPFSFDARLRKYARALKRDDCFRFEREKKKKNYPR